MTGDLRYPAHYPGKVTSSLWSSSVLRLTARVWGSEGRITLLNPLAPQTWHRLSVTAAGKTHREGFTRRSTYAFQLDAFVRRSCGVNRTSRRPRTRWPT